MAKQVSSMVDVLPVSDNDKAILRRISAADPKGFGFINSQLWPAMAEHKAKTGETLGMDGIGELFAERFGAGEYQRGSKAGQARDLSKAQNYPVYGFLNAIASKYGRKGKIYAPAIVNAARLLLVKAKAATPGLEGGRSNALTALANEGVSFDGADVTKLANALDVI